ncbi:hypothetical protein Cdeb_01289 [Caldibacillus debilis GB1]|uniref:Uncharacterized protein n=1 Tax=Caldibacillus debilis GB1 TaxID=1339248 RepID=A0A420VE00_9BACI|nr:hypothetical protein Cdeb_01289 [Caldibacillus debilis GB1]
MNKSIPKGLIRCLFLICIGVLFMPSAVFASDWIDSDPFTLTYQQVSSTEGKSRSIWRREPPKSCCRTARLSIRTPPSR